MRQPTSSLLRSLQIQQGLSHRQSFSTRSALSLWNGTTAPVVNKEVPPSIHPTAAQQATTKAAAASRAAPTSTDEIRRIHTKFIEDLLSRAAASDVNAFDKKPSSSSRRQRTRQHSLSEPPLFRTDGPLTPYPIELDTGEKLEPKHATLVRIFDKGGAQRSIVVAEVDDDTGKQRSVLLAVDLKEYKDDKGSAVGRRISAEEMYASLGLEGAKP
jgi:hypothetical protein